MPTEPVAKRAVAFFDGQAGKGCRRAVGFDIVRLAQGRGYDVAVVFSQDQDLSEAADEIRVIAHDRRQQ